MNFFTLNDSLHDTLIARIGKRGTRDRHQKLGPVFLQACKGREKNSMNIQIRYVGVRSYNRDILSCVRYPEKDDSFIDVRERETKQQIDKRYVTG